jgi:hypothetical protein
MQNRRIRVDHEFRFAIANSNSGIPDTTSATLRDVFLGTHGIFDASKVDEGTLFVRENLERLDWAKGAEDLHEIVAGEAGIDVSDPE